ncbi:hypothetical protein STEG23_010312, partial [Scotinomys teguina]
MSKEQHVMSCSYLGAETTCLDRTQFSCVITIYIVLIHLDGKSIHKGDPWEGHLLGAFLLASFFAAVNYSLAILCFTSSILESSRREGRGILSAKDIKIVMGKPTETTKPKPGHSFLPHSLPKISTLMLPYQQNSQ